MEDSKPRSIDELYYVELSDMTPEELTSWIEYQKNVAAREAATKTHMEVVNACLETVSNVYREQAEDIRNKFIKMTEDLQNG